MNSSKDSIFFALKRLRDVMRNSHPADLDAMLARSKGKLVERLFNTHPNRHELIVLEDACHNPKQFPVHVLADEDVTALVGHIRAVWPKRNIWDYLMLLVVAVTAS